MPERDGSLLAAATALALLALSGSLASTAAAPPSSGTANPTPPSQSEQPNSAPGSGSSAAPGSKSDDLSRSGGVIRPPQNVDPKMPHASPPTDDVPRTPIIPPPGSPGGNQSIQPK